MPGLKILLILFSLIIGLCPVEGYKLMSGEGLWFCENSDTHGKGNLWLNGFGRGFYWDNPTVEEGGFPLKIFPCVGADYGLFPFLDVGLSSEVLSYGFQVPGNLRARLKATLPNNAKLRLFGGALSVAYTYNFLKEYASFGYRNDHVGFYAEGLMHTGGMLETRFIGDAELITWKSFLPLKGYLNVGYRMPLDRSWSFYDQLLVGAGIEYKSLSTDFFLEYQLEILNGFSGFTSPQTVRFVDGNNNLKVFPYYFRENPMYLTPGVRIRYENGLTLMVAVPITKIGPMTLTKQVGFPLDPISTAEKNDLRAQGILWTDGYSPFYADWKIVGKISYPLFYKMTNAETIRKFLLMRNKRGRQVIDIDEMMKGKKNETVPQEKENP